jgi:hypothetical protein
MEGKVADKQHWVCGSAHGIDPHVWALDLVSLATTSEIA